MKRLVSVAAALAVAALSVACGSDAGSGSEAETERQGEQEGSLSGDGSDTTASLAPGERVYALPQQSGNTFACATCHALSEPTDDGITRPGHPIQGAPSRATFKNGNADSFLDAVNVCLTEWMVADAWDEDSPDFVELVEFLADGPNSEEISFTIADVPGEADLVSGDPNAGRTKFNETCVVCHGEDGAGTQKAPPVTGFGIDPEHIAARVRTSGTRASAAYEGLTGGRMPFWSAERLSDADLLDIVAFVSMWDPDEAEEPVEPPVGGPSAPPSAIGSVSNCDATHPNVGQEASLRAFSHDVGGTVRIVDDCTLEFENFTFDGQGINVQFYGGLDGAFTFSMSGDLKRPEGYEGANFQMPLPDGITLDDFDAISVWCVPVGVSFGDGAFE